MSDNLEIFGLKYPNIDGIKVIDENGNELTYSRYPIEIPGDSDPAPVKFIDYDGTILYSYSAADFLALASLPTLVSHQGKAAATAWNWTLADAQNYVRAYGALIIGQEYARAEFDIELLPFYLAPYLGLAVNGTVTIDWGDGTSTNVTGTSLTSSKRTQHTYAAAGNYTIGVTTVSGSYAFYEVQYCPAINYNQTSSSGAIQNYYYSARVKGLRLPYGVVLSQYAFSHFASIPAATIPRGVTSVGSNAFDYCYLLKYLSLPYGLVTINGYLCASGYSIQCVTIPHTVTTIGNYAFQNLDNCRSIIMPSSVVAAGTQSFYQCYNLKSFTVSSNMVTIPSSMLAYNFTMESVIIPSGIKTLQSNAFTNCYSLTSLTLPSSVETIESGAFANCQRLTTITVLSQTPPTLSSAAFNGTAVATLSTIYVPNGKLATYQSTTNWSTYASRMVELPA